MTTKQKKYIFMILPIGLFTVFCFLYSLKTGIVGINYKTVARIVLSHLLPMEKTWDQMEYNVVMKIRFPRIAGAVLIGGGISCAGAVYQGIFKNPMASPGILGVSAGSGFGAALGIVLSLSSLNIALLSFGMGLLTVFLVYTISRRVSSNQLFALILTGIMLSALFKAGISYLKYIADPTVKLPAITFWLMGSLASIYYKDFFFFIPILLGLIPMLMLSWRLNVMAMGDEEAGSMGVNVGRLRLLMIVSATLLTSACIAISGIIGWIGLVIPHLIRRIFGSDYRIVLPAVFLIGASFLLLVDDLARTLTSYEINVGLLTSLLGIPFMLFLILREDKHE